MRARMGDYPPHIRGYRNTNAALMSLIVFLSLVLLFAALADPPSISAQVPPQQDPTPTPQPSPTFHPMNPDGNTTEMDYVFIDTIEAFTDDFKSVDEWVNAASPGTGSGRSSSVPDPSSTDADGNWIFPDDMPEATRQAYRALYADIHSFSDRQYGISVDFTPEIIVGPVAGACGVVILPTMRVDPRCSDESGLPRDVMAHEYLHLVQSWPHGTPNWMWEGSAEYFSYRYLDDAGIRDYATSKSIDIERAIRWNAPHLQEVTREHYAFYPLSFLAFDYLAEISHANAPIDYFDRRKRSDGEWE